jgi:hypothetical protein
MTTKAKKGQIAVRTVVHSATHAFGSGRGTERSTVYQIVEVDSTTRDGIVKTIKQRHGGVNAIIRGQVYTIPEDKQPAARSLFESLSWEQTEFEDLATLKAAILARVAA